MNLKNLNVWKVPHRKLMLLTRDYTLRKTSTEECHHAKKNTVRHEGSRTKNIVFSFCQTSSDQHSPSEELKKLEGQGASCLCSLLNLRAVEKRTPLGQLLPGPLQIKAADGAPGLQAPSASASLAESHNLNPTPMNHPFDSLFRHWY